MVCLKAVFKEVLFTVYQDFKNLILNIYGLILKKKFNILYFFIVLYSTYLYFFKYFIPLFVILYLSQLLILLVLLFVKKEYEYTILWLINKFLPKGTNQLYYFMYIYLFRQPFIYSYLFLYSTLVIIIYKNKPNNITEKVITLFYRLLFRYLFMFPYFIVKISYEIVKKIDSLLEFRYQDKYALF